MKRFSSFLFFLLCFCFLMIPALAMEDDVDGIINPAPGSSYCTRSLASLPERDGLAGTMDSIFGPYSPLTYDVDTVIDGNVVATATQVVPGLAGLDWPYIGSVFLFGLMLIGLYKLMGVVLR